MGFVKENAARRAETWQLPRIWTPYVASGIAAIALATVSNLLYNLSGPLPTFALIFACVAFFAVVAQYFGRDQAALALLAATVVTNRYTVTLFGLNLKAEHIAIAIALAIVGWRLLRREDRLRFDLPDLLLITWLLLNVLSGLINAPEPANSLKLAIMAAIVAGAYFAVTRLTNTRTAFVFATFALLIAGTGAAAFGILTHLIYPFGPNLGSQINPVTQQPTIYGSLWEGNIYGSFCAIVTIFWLIIRLSVHKPALQRGAEAGLLIGFLGLQVSLARGGWLAFLVGLATSLGIALILYFRHRDLLAVRPRRWAVFLPSIAVASVVLWLNPFVVVADYGPAAARTLASSPATIRQMFSGSRSEPTVRPTPTATAVTAASASPKPAAPASAAPKPTAAAVQRPSSSSAVARAASAGDKNDITYVQRKDDILRALRDWRSHPLIGWGPGSYGQKYITTSYTPAWLPTFSIRFLHDSGVLGLLLSHIAFALIAARGIRALWRTPDPLLQALLFGYIGAGVVLTLAYEITDGFQLAFAWMFLGLLVAGARIAESAEPVATQVIALRAGRFGTVEIERPQSLQPDRAGIGALMRTASTEVTGGVRRWRTGTPKRITALRTTFGALLRQHRAILLVTIAGLIPAFYRLGSRGLWGDEVWTAWWTFPRIFLRTRQPPDFPLHWILVTLTTRLGPDIFWVRLPSALLGVATVAAIFVVGRRLFDVRTAVIASLLLAIAPFQVWNTQEARPYIGLACYSVLSLYFGLLLLERPTRRRWLGFTVATTLNLLNQFFALLPLATILVLAVLIAGTRWLTATRVPTSERREIRITALRTVGSVVVGAMIALVLTMPLLLNAAAFLLDSGGGPGKTGTISSPVTAAFIVSLSGTFGAGRGWPLNLLIGLSIVGIIVTVLRRRWLSLLAVVAWLAIPLLALLALKTNHTFDPKYLIFMQPIYLLLIGHGVSAIIGATEATVRRLSKARAVLWGQPLGRVLASGILALILVFAMVPVTWASYRVEKLNDWSAVCDYLHDRVEAGDWITGDAYYQGIMTWCFQGRPGISLTPPNGQSPAKMAELGQNIWYINLGQTPEATLMGAGYEAIPRAEWARPGVSTQTAVEARRFGFSQAEHPVSLYYRRADGAPSAHVFHDVKGGGEWPDYAQVGPGEDFYVPLQLAPAAPRTLRIVFFDLQGRDLDIYVNGILLEKIKAGASGGKWVTRELPLPPELAGRFILRLNNPGQDISAFSEVEVRYSNGR